MINKLASLIELFLLNLLRKGYKFLFFLYFSQRVFHHSPLRGSPPLFYSEGLPILYLTVPTLSLARFYQFALVPSERLGQGFSGMIALLTVSSPYDIVLSVLIGLGRSGALNAASGALNAASGKSFSDRKLLGQANDS